jgi:hypothetical protein
MGNIVEGIVEMYEKELIGATLSNGATIIKVGHLYDDVFKVIAVRKALPHPYVVWQIDYEAEGLLKPYKGDYAETLEEALAYFKRR